MAALESGRWRWLGVLLLLAGLLVLLLSGREAAGATEPSGSCAGAVVESKSTKRQRFKGGFQATDELGRAVDRYFLRMETQVEEHFIRTRPRYPGDEQFSMLEARSEHQYDVEQFRVDPELSIIVNCRHPLVEPTWEFFLGWGRAEETSSDPEQARFKGEAELDEKGRWVFKSNSTNVNFEPWAAAADSGWISTPRLGYPREFPPLDDYFALVLPCRPRISRPDPHPFHGGTWTEGWEGLGWRDAELPELCTENFNGACLELPPWQFEDPVAEGVYLTRRIEHETWVAYDGIASIFYEGRLSDEYTTERMTAELLRDFPKDAEFAEHDAFTPGVLPAFMEMNEAETCVLGAQVDYRFDVETEPGTVYRLEWNEVTRFVDGRVTSRSLSEDLLGQGLRTKSSVHRLPPPASPGQATVENVSVRIVAPDGSGGGPGAGGPMGFARAGYPGCPGCGAGPGGSGSVGGISGSPGVPAFRIGLGSAHEGRLQAALELIPAGAFDRLGHRSLARLTTVAPDLEVIRARASDGRRESEIHQVRTADTLSEVVQVTPRRFEVRIHRLAAAGDRDPAAVPPEGFEFAVPPYAVAKNVSPLAVWVVEDLTGIEPSTRVWRITEHAGGQSRAYTYTWTELDVRGQEWSWTLDWPGGLRQDVQHTRLHREEGLRVETLRVGRPGRAAEYVVERTYRLHSWGEGLIEEREGEGAALRVRSWTYDPAGARNGTMVPLDVVMDDTGYWEKYLYDDNRRRVRAIYSPVGDAPEVPARDFSRCRMRTFVYADELGGLGDCEDDPAIRPDSPRLTEEWIQGQWMRGTLRTYTPDRTTEILLTGPSEFCSQPDDSRPRRVTHYYPAGHPAAGKVRRIDHPDATVTLSSEVRTAAGRIATVETGVLAADGERVVDGTRVVTVSGAGGRLLSRTTDELRAGLPDVTVGRVVVERHDEFGRPVVTRLLDGSRSVVERSCCGIERTVGADGAVTEWFKDRLSRPIAALRLGVLSSNVLDALGRVVAEFRVGSDQSVILVRSAGYDTAGRLAWERNALGGVTTHTESTASGRLVRTVTHPDGGRMVEVRHRDGDIASVTGDAVTPVRYERGMSDGLEFEREIRLDAEGRDTLEVVTRYQDGDGHPVREVYAAAPGQPAPVHLWMHDAAGRLQREIDPDGVSTLYFYSARGELAGTAVEAGTPNGRIDWAGLDRVQSVTNEVLAAGAPGNTRGVPIRRSRSHAWTRNHDPVSTLLETRETSVDGLQAWITSVSGEGRTETVLPSQANGWTRTTTEVGPDGTSVTTVARFGRTISVTRRDAGGAVLATTRFEHDAHGRLRREIDGRGAVTTYAYNAADQVIEVMAPPAGDGGPAGVTATVYDASLRPVLLRRADGHGVTNTFHPSGRLWQTAGAGVSPVEYAYDAQGRLTTMTTWADAATGEGPAVTGWRYDPYRGWLVGKDLPDAFGEPHRPGPTFAYSPAGRLIARTSARGITTTFDHNPAGEWVGSIHHDAVTPATVMERDRLGRPREVRRGEVVTTLDYAVAGVLTNELWAGGPLAGWRVGTALDDRGRPSVVSVTPPVDDGAPAADVTVRYQYDQGSRIRSVGLGARRVDYEYLPGAGAAQVSRQTGWDGDQRRLTVERRHDLLRRLARVKVLPSHDGALGFGYRLNGAGVREAMEVADGGWWNYAYDALGQLRSARRFWDDATPVAGQQFEYVHDHRGNRTGASRGGDAAGAGLRESRYVVRPGNELESRTVPGVLDILGESESTARVSVNGRSGERHGAYFHAPVVVDNQAGPAWWPVSVAAVDPEGTATNAVSGDVYLAAAEESFVYDEDGNLLRDGRWGYTWDADNRLIRMEALVGGGAWGRVEFDYDWQGRRMAKRVWREARGEGRPDRVLKFLHRGWNLQAVADEGNVVQETFAWGPDLSGTLEGAGGVGGLAVWARPGHGTNSSAGPSGAWFVAADGSGNVAGLVSAADGTWEARYEYGPFGEPLRATGPMAAVNPFRFSSRWHDDETALVYYGHRYYSPELGRWLSQDPAGEAMGGRNLHTFVGNDPVGRHDILGLKGGSSGGGQVDRGTARRLKREGCCHVFTMKVDATGFDWRSAQTMIRSVARHLEEPVGHSWVRLEGEGYVAEGGHSGETGQLGRNPRITRQDFLTYGRGVVTLAGMDVTAAGPMPGVLEADPANPIRWLRYVYEDGHWAEGSGGHTRVTSECSWCIGPGEFAAAREAVEALRSGDGSALKAYGLTGQQCTSTAAGIAAVAGIHLDPYVHLTFPPFVDLRGVTVRLWTDPQFAAVSFALPDKLAFEMKKASGGPRKICR